MLGIHMQRAMLILVIVSIPLAIIWVNTRPILVLLGQDHDISKTAGEYACFMVPSLFAYGLLQCLVKFLQTQNIVFPMMICSGITTLLHILICWFMVFKSSLGFRGAALANSISNWINVFLLVLYVKFSPSCAKTWAGFSKEAFHNIFTFFSTCYSISYYGLVIALLYFIFLLKNTGMYRRKNEVNFFSSLHCYEPNHKEVNF